MRIHAQKILIILTAGLCFFSGCVSIHQPRPLEAPPEKFMRTPPDISQVERGTAEKNLQNLLPAALPLPEHEKLTYNLRWTVFNVGTITAEIKGLKIYKERPVYVFKLTVKSNAWLSKIYHIDSTFISYMDAEYMRTIREEVNRKEGFYRKHAVVEYDQNAHIAFFHNDTDGTSKTFPIPDNVQDALSSVYYFRTLPLKVGDKIRYPIVASESVYDFSADIRKQRTISIGPFKNQQAVFVIPHAYQDNKPVKEGTMSGYFSTISTKIPLSATIKTPLFTNASAFLVNVEYPKK